MYPKSDLLEALSINTWFAALPLAERKAMVRAGEVTTFRAGEMLYRKGDAGGEFCGSGGRAFKVSTLGEDWSREAYPGRDGARQLVWRILVGRVAPTMTSRHPRQHRAGDRCGRV